MICPYVIEHYTVQNKQTIVTYGICSAETKGVDIFVDCILQFLDEDIKYIHTKEDMERYFIFDGMCNNRAFTKTWKATLFVNNQWQNVYIHPDNVFEEIYKMRKEKEELFYCQLHTIMLYLFVIGYIAHILYNCMKSVL